MTDTWTKKSDIPTRRHSLSTSAVDGKIYAIGGDLAGFGLAVLSTVEEYDPITDTWTKKADMPTGRGYFSTSVVNGKIYAIGGQILRKGSPTVEEYNPMTDIWTKKADMPTSRSGLSTSVVNGYIYAIGGGGSAVTVVEAYDTGVGIRVATISPQEGHIAGDEFIAISGSGFPTDAIVTIGGKQLTDWDVTDTLITGITPLGEEGERDVFITTPSIDYQVFAGKFIYKTISNVAIKGITPTNGKQAGGDTGSITGSGFLPGATVLVDGIKATNVVVAATLITFTIPPGTEGAKDVIVTNPDGQKDTLHSGYIYNPFPVIDDIEPYESLLAGRTQITITGDYFMPGIFVTIGDKRIQRLDFFSPTELRFRTPADTAGPKDVRVVNPDGQEAILKEGFTYNPAPAISSVSPNMASLEGGTEITITGTGFLSGADVLIGGAEASYEKVGR